MKLTALLARIDEYRERSGESDRALAIRAGLSGDAIRNWRRAVKEGRDAGANVDSVGKLASIIDGDILDAMVQPGAGLRETPAEFGGLVSVFDVAASAGYGVVLPEYEAVAYSLAFPPGYLRTITNTSAEQLEIISVKGESMAPTLRHDDIVMIDRTKRSLGYDGIFVMRFDETIHVKRVGRASTAGVVRIISDNRAEFPEFERRIADVEVIGKVVWMGKKA